MAVWYADIRCEERALVGNIPRRCVKVVCEDLQFGRISVVHRLIILGPTDPIWYSHAAFDNFVNSQIRI